MGWVGGSRAAGRLVCGGVAAAGLLGDFKFVLQSHQPQGVEGIDQRLTEAAPVVHLEASAGLYIGILRLADSRTRGLACVYRISADRFQLVTPDAPSDVSSPCVQKCGFHRLRGATFRIGRAGWGGWGSGEGL
jgi:hypothetical protein